MMTTPLQELAQSLVNCQRCKLAKLGRTQVVFGVGNPQASIMFVGEAPGFHEDQPSMKISAGVSRSARMRCMKVAASQPSMTR